jgi:K+-sensing histidine kinase KdpD
MFALSVSNSASPHAASSTPVDGHGLGMKIIGAFVVRIDGELVVTPLNGGNGIKFSVLFS